MSQFRVRTNVDNLVHHKINKIFDQLDESSTIYSFEDNEYVLSGRNIGCLTVTLCAGGAAGGSGSMKNGIIYSGAGGGGGSSQIKKPIMIVNPKKEDIIIKTK